MRYIILLALMVLPAIGLGNKTPEIVITNAWVREAPPGVTALAGYMSLINQGKQTVVLDRFSSTDFERVELHQTRIEGDVARMEKKNSLSLSSGGTVKLQPGGYHLMLFKPKRPLRAGDQITLSIGFKDGFSRTVKAEVRAVHDVKDAHQHHQH